MLKIQEKYEDYEPSKRIIKSIHRLIRFTPKRYLLGLQIIILTNKAAFNRRYRKKKTKSRKRKISLMECYGWYDHKWKNNPARIVLLIDNIIDGHPSWVLRFNFTTDMLLGRIFYHELGHHIHATQSPEFVEREDVAEKWKKRLGRRFWWRRYWYIAIPFRAIEPLVGLLEKRVHNKQINQL